MDRRDGFTLIELLIVLAIIGVLVGIVSLAVGGIAGDADETANSAQMGIIHTAMDSYRTVDMVEGAQEIPGRLLPDVVGPSSADAPFGHYLRRDTKYLYNWLPGGELLNESPARVFGAVLDDGKVNKGFRFDREEISEGSRLYPFVRLPDHESLDLTTEGTIMGWVYIATFEKGAGVAHKGESSVKVGGIFEDEAYCLQFRSANSATNQRKVELAVVQEDNSITYLRSNALPDSERWYHMAGTWGPNGMDVYVHFQDADGQEVYWAKHKNDVVVARLTDGPLIIGARLSEPFNNNVFNYGFDGILDEVAVYPRALTGAEVQAIYDSTK